MNRRGCFFSICWHGNCTSDGNPKLLFEFRPVTEERQELEMNEMSNGKLVDNSVFEDLFVLEMANNHWGSVERGKAIIDAFGAVVRKHGVKAAIKMQFRDVENFIHPEFKGDDERYIQKTEATKLSLSDFAELTRCIIDQGCLPMATPFDEKSVGWCETLDYDVIKIASSDINDWSLLSRIAETGKPVIVSTGGAHEEQIDAVVEFFNARGIPISINHCVSLYPSEDSELELSQIDYLVARYPNKVIGLSTHEYTDWYSSMLMSYAKGARTWERHIDIDDGVHKVSSYCSLPHQIDEWFSAYKKARTMNGSTTSVRRHISGKEKSYLDNLARGAYARGVVPSGTMIDQSNFDEYFFLAVPLLKGQLSGRETLVGAVLAKEVKPGEGLYISDISNADQALKVDAMEILERGRKTDRSLGKADTASRKKTYMAKMHLRVA